MFSQKDMNLKLSNLKIEGNDFSYSSVDRKLHPSAGTNV